MFLTVWLRRQEIEYQRTRTILTGLSDIIRNDNSNSVKAFEDFKKSLFPFVSGVKASADSAMIETMEREVSKGNVAFNTLDMRPIRKAAETHQLPDEFRAKLRDSADARRKRRST